MGRCCRSYWCVRWVGVDAFDVVEGVTDDGVEGAEDCESHVTEKSGQVPADMNKRTRTARRWANETRERDETSTRKTQVLNIILSPIKEVLS